MIHLASVHQLVERILDVLFPLHCPSFGLCLWGSWCWSGDHHLYRIYINCGTLPTNSAFPTVSSLEVYDGGRHHNIVPHSTGILLHSATMGKANKVLLPDKPVDPTSWMIDNDVANFLLLHQKEVLYMCMVSRAICHSSLRLSWYRLRDRRTLSPNLFLLRSSNLPLIL
jgi:hypothetical protein